ncbi:hypothetical protein MCI89_14010 [Muricomes sp. OA1]|uniref:hypothetical protein n=1 Tax=Lachnospiraceae TaxID=186803 RepID=UPI001F05FF21|nr:hypothetical protein [Muricomes sp. OA1]MBS6765234.1 hypothetical protein [Clostridium sp.]MCH1973458.1 hypothetical protein [Muricomes sp. OA1]
MKVKEEKTKDLRAKCNNIFYDKDSRKEIEEAITKKAVELKGASEASVLRVYDVLALQMNELQRLNRTMESIFEIIRRAE